MAEASAFDHISVLSREVLDGLQVRPGGQYLDATVGGGGHSGLILKAAPDVHLTAIDRDATAIAAAQTHLPASVQFWQGNFADYPGQPGQFDGILADLGVSSPQLDRPERGFSFQQAAPLDMRMDQGQPFSAAEVVNHYSEVELVRIFSEYGEERFSKRIARAIAGHRPLHTTTDLVEVILNAIPPQCRHGRIHPATRVFQAVRIAVNGELTALEQFLNRAPHWLKPGGRIAMISFHSLEDRIVKYAFRGSDLLQVITKKPMVAQGDEQKQNRRSRSAKLRLAQRVIRLE